MYAYTQRDYGTGFPAFAGTSLEVISDPSDFGAAPPPFNLMGLGAIPDDQARAIAETFAAESRSLAWSGFSPQPLAEKFARVLQPYDVESRNKILSAFLKLDGYAPLVTHVNAALATSSGASRIDWQSPRVRTGATIWSAVSLASSVASVYHGYKRNQSVGWAIVWGIMGALFPIITPVVAVAQGYGKPAK